MLTNKTEGHRKEISYPAVQCQVPLFTHFQLEKAHQQVSRTGNWHILFPIALESVWSWNRMEANWDTGHSACSPSSFSWTHQINPCAFCYTASLRNSEDVDNKGHEEGEDMQNVVEQCDLGFVKKVSKAVGF